MSFYGGRPGKSFSIDKIFSHYGELAADMEKSNSMTTASGDIDLYRLDIPIGSFVMITYGSLGSEDFNNNKAAEIKYFEESNKVPDLHLGNYNATLWWDAEYAGDYNASVWVKRYDGSKETNKVFYTYVTNLAGIIPEISKITGNWMIGLEDTGVAAQGKQIEFGIDYDRKTGYTLLGRNVPVIENPDIEPLNEENIIYDNYGLTDKSTKYSYNEIFNSYDLNPNGDYYLVYASNPKGEFIFEYGRKVLAQHEDKTRTPGYFTIDEWTEIETQEISTFKTDWLRWRFIDSFEEDGITKKWTDLFEITGLTSVEEYRNDALNYSQRAGGYYEETQKISDDIKIQQEEINTTAEALKEGIGTVNSAVVKAEAANTNISSSVDRFQELLNNENIDTNEINKKGVEAYNQIEKATENFGLDLNARLELMPYQFNSIDEMTTSPFLKEGDRVFTFGMDNIGDGDSSKLFQIFQKDDEYFTPDEEGNEVEGYDIRGTNLKAGLLTVFSGYGTGGGGGGSAVPSLTVTGDNFSLQDGEVITLDYYWTGPNAGNATLTITDSNKDTPKVVDYYDPTKVYSSGVKIATFGAGQVHLKPLKGEHYYTFNIVDRAGAYSNQVTVRVIVGDVSLKVREEEGKSFLPGEVINYSFTVDTIYNSVSVLEYSLYHNGILIRQGEVESATAQQGEQSIVLPIKASGENIGYGEFKIVAKAYVKDEPSIQTNSINRNFAIMEVGKIYLSTSLDSEFTIQKGVPFFVPLNLIYSSGSNFEIIGRYSKDANYDWTSGWEKAKDIPPHSEKDGYPIVDTGKTEINYNIIFSELGEFYLKFKVSSTIDSSLSGEMLQVLKVTVVEPDSKYVLQDDTNLVVHYSARYGQTNEANKKKWQNLVNKDYYTATLENFNYLSNGWETDSNGVPTGYLYCNSETYVESSEYDFFQNITQKAGATFEFVFKSIDIGKDQTILSLSYDPVGKEGFFIYKDKVVVNMPTWGLQNLTAYYNINGIEANEEPVHVTITIDPQPKKGIDTGYVKIYINGVLCRANAEIAFSKINYRTSLYINRGFSNTAPNHGVVKVDCLRMYKSVLTPVKVLRNYVYNLRDDKKQAEIWNKNFLDSDNENTLPADIPYMTFYLTKNEWETMDKDNIKPKIKVTYHDPNPAFGNEVDYEWEKVTTSWQGTSSIAYPVKNFKIKLPSKYYLKGPNKSLAEKTFCLKADYMDSSHCHNTGNANLIHSSGLLSNYALTPPQSHELGVSVYDGYQGLLALKDMQNEDGTKKYPDIQSISPENLKNRTTIDGYPIVLYICLEKDEQSNPDQIEYDRPIFWGIYNFNLDKGSTDSFGLRRDRDEFQNVISFEIAANSAFDGGGFRAMRFVQKSSGSNKEYGWTKWNVRYNKNESINMTDGEYLYITKAKEDGSTIEEFRPVQVIEGNNEYIGIYNNLLNVKGLYNPTLKYTEDGDLDNNGEYIELYALDDKTDSFAYDIIPGEQEGEEIKSKIVLGYYKLDTSWSTSVPKDSYEMGLVSEWELYGGHHVATSLDEVPAGATILKTRYTYRYNANGMIGLETSDKNKIPANASDIQEIFKDCTYVILKNPVNQDFKYEYYEGDFELRFPDEDIFLNSKGKKGPLYYKEYDKLASLVEWVDNVAEDFDFKNHFDEHFDKNTVFNYYLMLMAVGLIDNFGKNLMIDTWGYDKNGEIPYLTYQENDKIYHKVWKYNYNNDEFTYGLMDMTPNEDGLYAVYKSNKEYNNSPIDLIELAPFTELGGDGEMLGWYHETDISQYIWYPHFYDLDSCLGVNNSGVLSFSPSIEMEDNFYINYEGKAVQNAPFNTSSSALWQQVVKNFSSELSEAFNKLVKDEIFIIDTFEKYYNQDIVKAMGARMYNNDAGPKYLSKDPIKVVVAGKKTSRYPYSFDHLALGNDWERISTWLQKRLTYLSTMFNQYGTEDYASGFELRSALELPYNFRVECYDPMYLKVIYKNNKSKVFRLTEPNQVINFGLTAGGATDQEIYFVPGFNVKSVKEVSSPQQGFSSAKLDMGTRLLELDLSNSEGLESIEYSNPTGNLIRKLNLSNCPSLAYSIQSRNFPYLEYVNTMGSPLAKFNFDENGGILKTAELEGSTLTSLVVNNYADLENLNIQITYPNDPGDIKNLPMKHGITISTASFVNCANDNFKINLFGRYLNTDGTTYSELSFDSFIRRYGVLSIFPYLIDVTLKNTCLEGNNAIVQQMQPDGSVATYKELKLALPRLERLEVINTYAKEVGGDASDIKYDKIAFIQINHIYDGVTKRTGYPGWGQSPDITKNSNGTLIFSGDTSFISNTVEGVIGDRFIKELEFRPHYEDTADSKYVLPIVTESTKFDFPWRIYLGSLIGLKKLKFNAVSISPKLVYHNSNIKYGDTHYLTYDTSSGVDTKNGWLPARFELILPSAEDGGNLELIYFNPAASNIEFTCIRQKDRNLGEYAIMKGSDVTYPVNWPNNNLFENILVGKSDSDIGVVNYTAFRGVDLRGYNNLAMNFKGLSKIKGILGMNALSVSSIDAFFKGKVEGEAFKNYFKKCNSLESFYSTAKTTPETSTAAAVYDYDIWTFADWFQNSDNSKYLKNISSFFSECNALEDTTFLTGLLLPDVKNAKAFAIEDASALFEQCTSLKKVIISWIDNGCLSNINKMFFKCSNLTEAKITITNIDTELNHIQTLEDVFNECEALDRQPNLILTTKDNTSHIKNISSIDRIFRNCIKLTDLDFSMYDAHGVPRYNFNNLNTAIEAFSGCEKLKKISFIDNVNFSNLTDFNNGFFNCKSLTSIFDNDFNKAPIFYDAEGTTKELNFNSLFLNCEKLASLGSLTFADLRRVKQFKGFLSNCQQIGSNKDWEIKQNMLNPQLELDTLAGALDLTNIKFGDYLIMDEAFQNCSSLISIKFPVIKVSSLKSLFTNCSKLIALDVSNIIPVTLNALGQETSLTEFTTIFSGCNSLDINFTGYQNWDMNKAINLKAMFQGCSSLTNLDLSNWKILNSDSNVTLQEMFMGCSNLTSIPGLDSLFGEYEDVVSKEEGLYNIKTFQADGVQSLFAGCKNLDFSTICLAAWARMAKPIFSVKDMFYECSKLIDLKPVFAKKDVFGDYFSSDAPLWWGGNRFKSTNCAFTNLADFSNMCHSSGIVYFDYFDDDNNVGYDENSLYKFPTSLSDVTFNCTSLTSFVFKPTGAGMHNTSMMGPTFFHNDSQLTNILFPTAVPIGTIGNLGIKYNFGPSDIMNDNTGTTEFFKHIDFPSFLYDFTGRNEKPDADAKEGKFYINEHQADVMTNAQSQGFAKKGWDIIERPID